jgi:hypothetical protein
MHTVEFQDDGQDFLEWDIDDNGVVVESRPFQTMVWGGSKVDTGTMRKGRRLAIVTSRGTPLEIIYPIVAVR